MNSKNNAIPKAGEAVELEMFIHKQKYGLGIAICDCDLSSQGYACFGKAAISFTMPDGDVIKAMVVAIQEEIKTERANHHVKITQLEDKIQQLLAIGHDGGVE